MNYHLVMKSTLVMKYDILLNVYIELFFWRKVRKSQKAIQHY